jgi:hypothetical protein
MDRNWIDNKIKTLSLVIGFPSPTLLDQFYFEPTKSVYDKLGTGYESDLQSISNAICEHLGISFIPACKYSWSITMEPECAGQCKLSNEEFSIQIPFSFVGNKYAVGSILAHEMAHILLLLRGVCIEDHNENEMFTDLTAIFVGLGKLILNGIVLPLNDQSERARVLGYLSPDLMFYSYAVINKTFSIDNQIALANLIPDVQKRITYLSKQL